MRSNSKRICALAAASVALMARPTHATVYSDSVGDNWSPGSAYVDLTGVEITNDATNLNIKITVGPGANLLDVNQQYGNYEMGLQFKPGGQTQINNDYSGGVTSGNPYGTPVGYASGNGDNTFVAFFGSGGGGGDAYNYDASTGWSHNWNAYQQPDRVSLTATTINATIPLQYLGLTPGATFKFDVWSTFGGDNSAYDALDNPQMTFSGSSRLPYGSGGVGAAAYDSTVETPTQFNATTYTVTGGGIQGDANNDGKVDSSDFQALAAHFNEAGTASATGDFNGDGKTNSIDFNILATNYGMTSPAPALGTSVPEPAALSLIAGSLLLVGRRRMKHLIQ